MPGPGGVRWWQGLLLRSECLECAKVNDKESRQKLCTVPDDTSVGMLNYVDGRLLYVSFDSDAQKYEVKSVKDDGSDSENIYTLNQRTSSDE